MAGQPDPLQRLLDRAEIADCLARYCRGVDRCDPAYQRALGDPRLQVFAGRYLDDFARRDDAADLGLARERVRAGRG